MFGIFKSAEKDPAVIDKVWISKAAKINACRQMLTVDPSCIFIAWFEKTRDELNQALNLSPQATTVFLADNIMADQLQNRIVAFVEHHPLRSKEVETFKRIKLSEVNVLSSLDEPFFVQFGNERLIEIMRKLGMKEDEVIGHSMINRAIKNAQEKIEKKVVVEKVASSQEEWFQRNVVNGI